MDFIRCRLSSKYQRRKSLHSETELNLADGLLEGEDSALDAAEEKLWFPIGKFWWMLDRFLLYKV